MPRKSVADLSVIKPESHARPQPPGDLAPEAAALWRSIVGSLPAGRFHAGDLPLLREFCYTATVLLPRVNGQLAEDADNKKLSYRTMLVKELATLAAKLRLCVSARTRGDLAEFKKGDSGPDWSEALK